MTLDRTTLDRITLDRRLNAYRADLADARLRGIVAASRYIEGRPARTIAGRAAVYREPAAGAALDTFYHYGEDLLVFDVGTQYAWCQSLFDGYVGYVEARHITTDPAPAPTHFVTTPGSYCYEAADLRSRPIDFLPRHSAVAVTENGLDTRGTAYVRLATGSYLPAACLSPAPPVSPDIATAAALYLGCPYRWGGRSFLGLDCSGLVQNAFRDIGIAVRRDTDLQRDTIGTAVPIDNVADLRRGDLLYVPGHVLICEGGDTMIHADGASMTVRRDDLAEWLRARGLILANLVVRRHPAAAGS
ncbi:MAG TPA: NlpC/P60 family protein [Stellaceae bacterium]|jgi:cell wall-associated NlpC family hydrolase|nr:NlpC/P60 family protein [Stellaceae bacterium]